VIYLIRVRTSVAFVINGLILIYLICVGLGQVPHYRLKDDSAWLVIAALGVYEIYLGIKLVLRIIYRTKAKKKGGDHFGL
jgi:hypothetical protein